MTATFFKAATDVAILYPLNKDRTGYDDIELNH